ncbi:MAG: mechanosensitive ion channel family protein [Calothrix sp. MO_167.B12]|nr:mechanosensitive ion channel family protein [Calothrix sp. MO_167.B12]
MDRSILIWGLVIILGVPFLALILLECIRFMEQRQSLLTPVLRNLWRYVLPLVAILAVMRQLLRLEATALPVRLVETGVWLATIVTFLSLINAVLTTKAAKSGTFQFQVPNLFFQAIRAGVILLLLAQLLGSTWQINVGGIVQALGVGSLVIALALQDTFSSLVSGLLLLLDRPFKIGDWIEFDGTKGYVVEQNWRSVTLSHPGWEKTIVVPNGVLARAKIDNFGQEGIWRRVTVSFSYDDPPNRVLSALESIFPGLDRDTNPNARLTYPKLYASIDSFGDSGINYSIWFKKIPALGDLPVLNALMSRIYSMAKRQGFTIPYPIAIQYNLDLKAGIPTKIPNQLENRHEEIFTFLRSLSYLSYFNSTVLETLAEQVTLKDYALGELIVQAGEPDEGLYILLQGRVKLFVEDIHGEGKEVYRLSAGDFFGEMALLPGELSPVSVIALNDVQVLIITHSLAQNLIDSNPKFAQEMNQYIEERKRSVYLAQGLEKISPENVEKANRNDAQKLPSLLSQLTSDSPLIQD